MSPLHELGPNKVYVGNEPDPKARIVLGRLPNSCMCFLDSPPWDGHRMVPPCETVLLAREIAMALDFEISKPYGRALGEIYTLRRLLTYEAAVLDVHLGYKTFPKTRRMIAEGQVRRMRDAARGHSMQAISGTNYLSLNALWKELNAGHSLTLTRAQWEGGEDA